jgi:hypothetical protein
MRAALSNLDEGEFTEGHELDLKWKVPEAKTNDMMSWWRALVVDNLGEDDPAMVPTSM